eukprot:7375891-Prymnesium_polylepis.3
MKLLKRPSAAAGGRGDRQRNPIRSPERRQARCCHKAPAWDEAGAVGEEDDAEADAGLPADAADGAADGAA